MKLLPIILLTIISINLHGQYTIKDFADWCLSNPDTVGFDYILSVDTSLFHSKKVVLETKKSIFYNSFNNNYSGVDLWLWDIANSEHNAIIEHNTAVIDTYIYFRPIIKNKSLDNVNLSEYQNFILSQQDKKQVR